MRKPITHERIAESQVIKVPADVTKKIICDKAAKLYRIELT